MNRAIDIVVGLVEDFTQFIFRFAIIRKHRYKFEDCCSFNIHYCTSLSNH